jgi:hypothetical protein
MADDEGIGGIYRIPGVMNIGTPHVFPKSRVVKKKKRQPEEEEEARRQAKENELSESSDLKRKSIDIEV